VHHGAGSRAKVGRESRVEHRLFANPTKALAQHGDGRRPRDRREVVEDHVETLTSREVRE